MSVNISKTFAYLGLAAVVYAGTQALGEILAPDLFPISQDVAEYFKMQAELIAHHHRFDVASLAESVLIPLSWYLHCNRAPDCGPDNFLSKIYHQLK